MVVFIDFENEDDDPLDYSPASRLHSVPQRACRKSPTGAFCGLSGNGGNTEAEDQDDTTWNGRTFASALACYPVSLSLAKHLDLNDLYALSFTCRKIHHNLSRFARQLRNLSLHCLNDVPPQTSEQKVDATIFQEALEVVADSIVPEVATPAFPLPYSVSVSQAHTIFSSALGLSGKVSKCARDMVAPCRKCGTVVCRNCAAKPLSDRNLPNRHRRLCLTCLESPVIAHLCVLPRDHDFHDLPPTSGVSSTQSTSSGPSSAFDSNRSSHTGLEPGRSFTFSSFLREPCNCATRGVYLCQPCGQSLIAADTTYKRVWTWRSRYSTHIGGGLGTGLGLGNQGQKCGRAENCLDQGVGGVCWVEIDCSEARAHFSGREDSAGTVRSRSPLVSDQKFEPGLNNKPGYLSQELEGIGGVLKKKVKKRVKVGAPVYEYDDERETGAYLQRESTGKQRSWCGWCSRVCPGEKDQIEVNELMNPLT